MTGFPEGASIARLYPPMRGALALSAEFLILAIRVNNVSANVDPGETALFVSCVISLGFNYSCKVGTATYGSGDIQEHLLLSPI